MSRVKISELTAATTSIKRGNTNRDAGKVIIPLVDGNTTKSITVDNLFESAGSISSSVGIDVQGPIRSTSLITSGSSEFSGSVEVSGSVSSSALNVAAPSSTLSLNYNPINGAFNAGNLLRLLGAFGATGLGTGSDSPGVAVGDINLDGQVNINDFLLALSGFGQPSNIANSITIPENVNHQLVGPVITMIPGVTNSEGETTPVITIEPNAHCSITN